MILAERSPRAARWPLRLLGCALALAALPLSVNMLGAEPAEPARPAAPAEGKVEQRLERLEKMIAALGQKLRVGHAAAPREATADVATDDEAPVDVPGDLAEMQKSFEVVVKKARVNLQLTDTNFNRTLASARQVEAVRKAYEAETVTLDQLLEAQRRFVDSQVSYAQTVSELCGDRVQRQYLFEQARLVALSNALNEARRVWKEIHTAFTTGGAANAEQEAQAREQYFLFKTTLQKVASQFERTRAAAKADEQPAASGAAARGEMP